ncbi:MAG TPA: hypothetical protein ENK17_04420 [Anaerolineae bacterium]|nr:hypothetical protein [Anaerolineae bacterium]
MRHYTKSQRSRIFFWFTSLLVVLSMSLSLVATFVPTRHVTPTPVPTYTPFPTRTPTPMAVSGNRDRGAQLVKTTAPGCDQGA